MGNRTKRLVSSLVDLEFQDLKFKFGQLLILAELI